MFVDKITDENILSPILIRSYVGKLKNIAIDDNLVPSSYLLFPPLFLQYGKQQSFPLSCHNLALILINSAISTFNSVSIIVLV